MRNPSLLLVLLLALVLPSLAYRLVSNYSGNNFFSGFQYFTGPDPTHGYVYYASQAESNAWGYTYVSNGVVYIRSDSSSVSSGSGRGSVRLTSSRIYNHALFIIDVAHMPTGCGNWPAIWTVGPNWPYNGEIDIIEGVNLNNRNQMTLHSGPGCNMPSNWNQAGKTLTTDCNSANGANGNQGCGVQSSSDRSFGGGFNNNGGGVFAMQWENSGVFIWFFERGQIPGDIQANNPDTTRWGTPAASFPFAGTGPGSCPTGLFKDQQIVIDNTFCGDWAGNTFNSDGCSGNCHDFVQNNPRAFSEAYWAIHYIRVYEQ